MERLIDTLLIFIYVRRVLPHVERCARVGKAQIVWRGREELRGPEDRRSACTDVRCLDALVSDRDRRSSARLAGLGCEGRVLRGLLLGRERSPSR